MRKESWTTAIQSGIRSVKATWPPMLVIQIATFFVVFGYYASPAIRDMHIFMSNLKDQGGMPFIIGSGFIAGGLLPELAKLTAGRVPKLNKEYAKQVFFTGLVYGIVAVLVFYLYKLQVLMFGDVPTLGATTLKVAFDMLVFSPFLSMPFATGMFIWRRNNYKFSSWKKVFTPAGYSQNVLPTLVLCWAFWTPVLACVYVLPEKLQFVVAILCEAAWSIVFVFTVDSVSTHVEIAPPE